MAQPRKGTGEQLSEMLRLPALARRCDSEATTPWNILASKP